MKQSIFPLNNMDINELLITSSVSSEQSACLWDYNTLNVRKLFKNGGVITSKSLEVVGEDYILASELGIPILHVWPLNSQECSKNSRLILPGEASCLALCPRNIYLAAGINCKAYVWQLTSGKLLSIHQKNYQPVTIIKFSSDGDYLLIAGEDGILVVYNFAELINLSNSFLTQTDIGQVEPVYVKNDHSMPITDLHVGSFGRKSHFATVSSDQTCRIYNLADGETLLTLVFNEPLTATIFDAPCWQLFVGNNNGSVYQFNLKNPPRKLYHHIEGKDGLVFEGHKSKIVCLALNISNTVLATGSDDNFVYIWEIRSRQIIKRIEHKGSITNVKFVLGYHNFFSEKFKPCTILRSLERSINMSDTKFSVSQMQTCDIKLDDDGKSLEKEHSLRNLSKENTKLRCINRQLYDAALEISKKYNTT